MSMFRAFHPKLVLVLLAGLWLVGCSTSQKAGIVVSLVKVEATEVALTDTAVVLQLRLQNENLMAIALTSTKHKVYLNDVYFGQAVGQKPVGLAERGDVSYAVTLKLANAAAAAQLREMMQRGVVNYRLESVLLCDAGDDELKLLSTDSGQINLR